MVLSTCQYYTGKLTLQKSGMQDRLDRPLMCDCIQHTTTTTTTTSYVGHLLTPKICHEIFWQILFKLRNTDRHHITKTTALVVICNTVTFETEPNISGLIVCYPATCYNSAITASCESSLLLLSVREKPGHWAPDPFPQQDVGERLALGSTEALANGNKADLHAAKRLAKRLFNLDGFRKSDVARHLSKKWVYWSSTSWSQIWPITLPLVLTLQCL